MFVFLNMRFYSYLKNQNSNFIIFKYIMLSQRVRIKENENCIDIHLHIQRGKSFLFLKQAIRIDKEYFLVIYVNKLLQEGFK